MVFSLYGKADKLALLGIRVNQVDGDYVKAPGFPSKFSADPSDNPLSSFIEEDGFAEEDEVFEAKKNRGPKTKPKGVNAYAFYTLEALKKKYMPQPAEEKREGEEGIQKSPKTPAVKGRGKKGAKKQKVEEEEREASDEESEEEEEEAKEDDGSESESEEEDRDHGFEEEEDEEEADREMEAAAARLAEEKKASKKSAKKASDGFKSPSPVSRSKRAAAVKKPSASQLIPASQEPLLAAVKLAKVDLEGLKSPSASQGRKRTRRGD